MRSGASGVACFEASFAVSAMRARECRLYSALFHYWACCERAAPDAPETIDDQRRCTGGRYRTIYGGSRGSASLPAPAKWFPAFRVRMVLGQEWSAKIQVDASLVDANASLRSLKRWSQ